MATLTQQTAKPVMNANVSATKQTITGEDGQVVRNLYYLTIKIGEKSLQINTGETNYNKIKEMSK